MTIAIVRTTLPETTVRYDKRGEEELMKKRRTTSVIA